MKEGEFYYHPFIVSSADFINKRLVSDQPGSPVTRNDLMRYRTLVTNLQTAYLKIDNERWEELKSREFQNPMEAIQFLNNISANFTQNLCKYVNTFEKPLFKATAGITEDAERYRKQIAGEKKAELEEEKEQSRIEEIFESMRELSSFIEKSMPSDIRGISMENFGLCPTGIKPNEDESLYAAEILKIKEQENKQDEPWLSIVMEKDKSPEIIWNSDYGPIDAIKIAKKLEEKIEHHAFKLENPHIIMIDAESEKHTIPVKSFKNVKAIYKEIVNKVDAPFQINQVLCRFSEDGPAVSIESTGEKFNTWSIRLYNFPWKEGKPEDYSKWVMTSLEGTYLTMVNIPGLAEWIKNTILKLLSIKQDNRS